MLKRVKNHLRSTLTQVKLCNLTLLTIESDLTKEIDFEDILNDFAKIRPKPKKD